MAFRTAVELLSNDFRIAMLTRLFPGWLMKPAPARIQRVGEAYYYYEFGNYLRELLKGEERAPSENENLFSALNHSNEAGRKAQGTGLMDSELVGNVFLFALAGYETTSVVLKYVVLNLALHPDNQAWLHGKMGENLVIMPEDPREWNYELFRKLTGQSMSW